MTPPNHRTFEASVCFEDDLDHQRRLGLVAVWDAASEADCQKLWQLLEHVPVRQRRVLLSHYGLDGRRARSLRKVAEEQHMSPTHARRLERRALQRLERLWPTPEVSQ